MSKAFTKEDVNSSEEDADSEPALPLGFKNYITRNGSEKLRNELRELLYEKRPEMVKTVSWAASNGDRSENGDYIYGKRRLREIDRRIRFLQKRIESAEIVDPSKQAKDRVLFGATVTVMNESSNQKKYRIVGIDESDPARGWVSWVSPLAKALLNSKKSDIVTLRTPKGEEELEIIEIEYVEV